MIGERIKTLRLAFDVKQKDFAQEFNISTSTLSLIEHGHVTPGIHLLEKIVRKYEITYDWLMDNETGPVKSKAAGAVNDLAFLSILITNIQAMMKEEKLTQSQFAKRCGFKQKWLALLLKEKVKPSAADMFSILNAFPEYNANWLLRDRGAMKNDATQQAMQEVIRGNKELVELLQNNLEKNIRFTRK